MLNGPTSFLSLAAVQSLPAGLQKDEAPTGKAVWGAPTRGCPRLRCSQLPCRPQRSVRGHGVQRKPALPLELQQQPRQRPVTRFLLPSSVCSVGSSGWRPRSAASPSQPRGFSGPLPRTGEPTAGHSRCAALGLGAISIRHPLPIRPVWPL